MYLNGDYLFIFYKSLVSTKFQYIDDTIELRWIPRPADHNRYRFYENRASLNSEYAFVLELISDSALIYSVWLRQLICRACLKNISLWKTKLGQQCVSLHTYQVVNIINRKLKFDVFVARRWNPGIRNRIGRLRSTLSSILLSLFCLMLCITAFVLYIYIYIYNIYIYIYIYILVIECYSSTYACFAWRSLLSWNITDR